MDILQLLRAQMGYPELAPNDPDWQEHLRVMNAAGAGPRLPPQDELIRPSGGVPTGSIDPGIVARPYTGPQTGDPVIGPRMGGTFDRDRYLLTPELKHQIRNPPYTQMPVAARERPQDQFLQQNAPVPTLSNPRPLAQNWVGEPNPNIPPPRAPGTLPPVLRPDLPAAPPTGNAPYQPTNEPIGFDTPLWNDRQAYTPPPMMPTQDYYSRPYSNLGFGGMGAYY
jgi:hypothetical protein